MPKKQSKKMAMKNDEKTLLLEKIDKLFNEWNEHAAHYESRTLPLSKQLSEAWPRLDEESKASTLTIYNRTSLFFFLC